MPGGGSPFRRVLERVAGAQVFDPLLVVTDAGGRFMISDQAAGVAVNVVVEPEPRDTLPAITAAGEHVGLSVAWPRPPARRPGKDCARSNGRADGRLSRG